MSKRIGIPMHMPTPIAIYRADQLYICHRTTRLESHGFGMHYFCQQEGFIVQKTT